MMGSGFMGGGFWGGWLAMILFWALVILGIVYLVRRLAGPAGETTEKKTKPGALEILQERYARGEIDQEEFLAKKKDLS
ncbi:MAG: electron transporter RnfE [Candidatus Portnoybacteria bacterium CG10_big_fil_rev_8_21_14_0_10_44_7]|uniref:Electron transporter RnfE n=1 Tax=Candidatus Portnoybacteria bacterium CG10_big_fil_rev_8_21_14_0_10_44_7 TaxID=1974816 RepID=A0A2M8KJC5_9BACT|nr:MAG: electron transporter RnfE [Candidatus Portnoybacteria bacterium CG10_big_fil_rev_8_21_14_0_10_44_7]